MLCLGRKVGQRVVIGTGENTVVVTVIEVRDGKVRLGFDADRSIPINREEVLTDAQRAVAGIGRQLAKTPA